MTKTVVSQVMMVDARLPRLRTYSTKCARPKSTAVSPMKTGDNQLTTDAAVLPANPSKERIAAAVQLGTIAAVPNNAPNALAARFPVVRFCSLIGFMVFLSSSALQNVSPESAVVWAEASSTFRATGRTSPRVAR